MKYTTKQYKCRCAKEFTSKQISIRYDKHSSARQTALNYNIGNAQKLNIRTLVHTITPKLPK